MNAPTHPFKSKWSTGFLAVVAITVGLCAITHQSFWMDEGSSAFRALMPTPREWWKMTLHLGGSDVQMPVYLFLVWGWQKLGASSEFALRCINLPWLVIAVLALGRVRFWPLVCLTSPFILYYSGELRPYAMQIAGGTLAAAAFLKIAERANDEEFEGLHLTAAASLVLACASLTGAVWSAGLWLGVLIARTEWLQRAAFWRKLLPWIAAALIMAAYYLFTLVKGYRASGQGGNGILSLMFGFYEMIGLLGLGPSRNDLRRSTALLIPALPILIPAFISIACAWLNGALPWLKEARPRLKIGAILAVATPIVVLAVVGQIMDFRVLGRHLSPAIPAVLLPIAVSLAGSGAWRNVGRISAVLAVSFCLISSLELRLLDRHARDDYRTASRIAFDALDQGRNVWWQADMNATRYYAYLEGGPQRVNSIQVLESNPPSSLMFADLVIISRPDLVYKNQEYLAELRRNDFKLQTRFTGFEVWKSR